MSKKRRNNNNRSKVNNVQSTKKPEEVKSEEIKLEEPNVEETKATEAKTEELKSTDAKPSKAKTEDTKSAETNSEETKSEDTNSEEAPKSKRKPKKRLGVIFLKEDEENGLEKKLVEPDKVEKISEFAIAIFIAVAMVAIMLGIRFVALDRTVRKLNNVIEEMSSKNESEMIKLTRENAELSEKVSLLSNQVAVQMVVDEENDAKKVPNGLPISGKVQVISEPETLEDTPENPEGEDEEVKEPIVVFGVENGSKIMASGNGVVTFVGYDEEYVYRVEIDHGNGYKSVYRFAGEPKVREGDEVLRAQMLFEVLTGDSVVGYQIILDEEFVDPMTVMEISG